MTIPDILADDFDEYMEWLIGSLGNQIVTEERVDKEYSTWLFLKSQLNDKTMKVPAFKGLPDTCVVTIIE